MIELMLVNHVTEPGGGSRIFKKGGQISELVLINVNLEASIN